MDSIYCPKCKHKMTVLFVSAVCDRCDPPKNQKIVQQKMMGSVKAMLKYKDRPVELRFFRSLVPMDVSLESLTRFLTPGL